MERLFRIFLWSFFCTLLITGGALYGAYKEELHSPCLPPLHYSIGEVDPRFGVSQAQFTSLAQQAEDTWERALGKNIFEYEQNAPFTLNLVFDDRQSKTNTGKQLESNIAEGKSSYESLSQELQSLHSSYDSLVADYNALEAEYDSKVAAYEKTVAYWNDHGGAPKDVYEDLQGDRKDLEKMADTLNEKAAKINTLAKTSGETVKEINETADAINSEITTYNGLFGGEREFDKGLYTGDAITVYQMEELGDLRLTLVHEFGHALGIVEHVDDDSQAIMYYLLRDQNVSPITLTESDVAAANHACRFDTRPSIADIFNWYELRGVLHELWPNIL